MRWPYHRHVHTSPAEMAACRAMIRDGSKTFFAASLLLPQFVRSPAYALYAFCRVADDMIDHSSDVDAALATLHQRLDDIYAGRPQPAPEDRALADVVRDFAIPEAVLLALLEGFAWDAEARRYHTIDDVLAYGARVAGTVGVMMAILMGARDRDRLARAADLGIAMQLSNIARDVGEDARNGRVYLPLDWLAEEGVDVDRFLGDPTPEAGVLRVTQRLLAVADDHYAHAEPGIDGLPWHCRPAIYGARLLYAEIGAEVARRGYDSVTTRAVVPGRRKARLLGQAVRRAVRPGPLSDRPVAGAAAFLLDAVENDLRARPLDRRLRVRWWHLSARWNAVLQLIADPTWSTPDVSTERRLEGSSPSAAAEERAS